MRNVADYGI